MKRITLWIVFFAVIALLVWGIAVSVKKDQAAVGTLSLPVSAADWAKGATSTSKVMLVEYSDFQCPACAAYEPLVTKALADFPTA
jgi:protein-disulfide isomerase